MHQQMQIQIRGPEGYVRGRCQPSVLEDGEGSRDWWDCGFGDVGGGRVGVVVVLVMRWFGGGGGDGIQQECVEVVRFC
jgi:hypothetical protein